MYTSTWISLAFAALLPSSALALDASGLPPQTSGSTKLERLTVTQPGSTGDISAMCAKNPTANVCRTLGERLTDVLNVKDYGARLDATQDDAPAYRAARAATKAPGERVSLPAGTRSTSTDIAGPRPVWWDIAGPLRYPDGSPVPAIGDDLTSSVLNGRTRLWRRENPVPRADPVFRVDREDTSSEMGTDLIQYNSNFNCNLRGKAKSVYCNVFSMKVHSGQPSTDPNYGSGHYNLYSVAERMPDSPPGAPPAQALYAELNDGTNLPDSASNGNSGMAMSEQDFYTNGTDLNNYRTLVAYRIGSYRNTFGANTANGNTTISGIDLRFALRPGNTVRGSCLRNGATTVASYVFAEGDSKAVLNAAATSTGRCALSVDTLVGEVGNGIDLSPATGGPGGRVGMGFAVNMPFYGAAFDTANGRSDNDAPSFRMAEGQRIAFDGSGRGYQAHYNRSLRYLQGSLKYQTQAGDVFQVSDDGKLIANGGLQIADLPAPTSTADPIGKLNDVRFNGPYMYRKTTSGWLRFSGSKF